MRKPPRIYLDQLSGATPRVADAVPLSERQYRHLISALRRGQGDPVDWFDGQGHAGRGVLQGSDRGGFSLVLDSVDLVSIDPPEKLQLLLGLPKPDAVDLALEYATQTGVGTIGLVVADRTPWKAPEDRLQKLYLRWGASVIDAAEQSGRLTVPLLKFGSLEGQLQGLPSGATLLVGVGPEETPVLAGHNPGGGSALVIAIGPEGGWSAEERAALAEAGGVGWTLPGATLTTALAAGVLPALIRWGA